MPQGLSVKRDEHGITIGWKSIEAPNGEPGIKYNIYCTLGDSIDIGNIKNLVASQITDNSFRWSCRTFHAISIAVTAVDAYGRESDPAIVTSGNESYIAAKEITLPQPASWGARVEVIDMWGRRLYKGRYSNRIGVRGVEGGYYMIKMYDRHGSLQYSKRFFTTGK